MPNSEYMDHESPRARVELCVLSLVDGRLSVLLGLRAEAPQQGKWGLPGGVIRIDLDKDLEAAAQRVSMERLLVPLLNVKQLGAIGNKTRDERAGWTVSVVYRALMPKTHIDPHPGKRFIELKWLPVDGAAADSTIAFDHSKIITFAAKQLREEIDRLEIPFDFLAQEFTQTELQLFCEAILGHKLDKSSFRRRVADKEIVEATSSVRTGAFRPAQLYRRRRR
jgi:8-oxo-dGTP diphosphatase